MIDINQRKSLQKLINSPVIKDIYPIIEHIDIHYREFPFHYISEFLIFDIYLNDPRATKQNLWDEFQLDYHYLIDHYVRNLLPYVGIDKQKVGFRFRIYDTNHNIIDRNDEDL